MRLRSACVDGIVFCMYMCVKPCVCSVFSCVHKERDAMQTCVGGGQHVYEPCESAYITLCAYGAHQSACLHSIFCVCDKIHFLLLMVLLYKSAELGSNWAYMNLAFLLMIWLYKSTELGCQVVLNNITSCYFKDNMAYAAITAGIEW